MPKVETIMANVMNATAVLDREFLELRAKLLEIGATLDRVERAEGDVAGDARMDKIHRAVETLLQSGRDRAEKIQMLFSLPYESEWRGAFDISK